MDNFTEPVDRTLPYDIPAGLRVLAPVAPAQGKKLLSSLAHKPRSLNTTGGGSFPLLVRKFRNRSCRSRSTSCALCCCHRTMLPAPSTTPILTANISFFILPPLSTFFLFWAALFRVQKRKRMLFPFAEPET